MSHTPTQDQTLKVTPRLEQGDHLTRAEFERRYQAMPHLKKAELIEGIVHMPSSVRTDQHGDPHADIMTWLGNYRAATEGVRASDNATVRLDLDNEPQPDATLRILPEYGGQTRNEEGYIVGAPELVVEIAASSASYDLHNKLQAYRRNGVLEYLVWRVLDEEIDWFALTEGRFDPLPADDTGVLRSRTFPGLWLDGPALLEGQLARVLACLQLGLASPAHQDFVAALEGQGPRP